MGPKFTISLAGGVDFREYNSSIPVSTPDDILSFIKYKDRLIILLDAPINLIDSRLDTY